MVTQYEDITTEYYGEGGDWNLPGTFYTEYMGFEERKKYLDGLIERITMDTLTDEDIVVHVCQEITDPLQHLQKN